MILFYLMGHLMVENFPKKVLQVGCAIICNRSPVQSSKLVD